LKNKIMNKYKIC